MNIKKIAYRVFLPLGIVLVVSSIAILLFLPRFIQSKVHEYGQSIGYQIQYQDLSISPWFLKVEMDGLEINQASGETLLKAKRLTANAEIIYLAIGHLHFSEITLDGLQLTLSRQANQKDPAQWNWLKFIEAIQAKKENKEKPSTLKVDVSEFHLKNAHLIIDDRITKTKYDLPQLNLSVMDLANYDPSGRAGAQGDYSIHLGALDLPIPGSANHLKLTSLGLSGHLELVSKEMLKVQMNLKINDAPLTSQIHLNMKSSELDGDLKFKDLPLAPWIALLPSNKGLLTEKGSVSADLKLKTASKGWSILGDIDFGELAIYEPGDKEALISWGQADLSKFELNFLDQAKRRLSIDELKVTRPEVRFTIGEDHLSNFRRMFSKDLQKPTESSNQSSSLASTETSKFQLDIKALKVSHGSMYFNDLSLKPQFRTRIRQLNGSFLGVSNVPGQYALIALDGQVDRSGSMRARGQMAFEDPRRNNEVNITFRNLPLNSINPYAITFAGHEIESGRMDADLKYATKNGRLVGKNHFVIHQIKLGKELEDFKGQRLPINLAISLLEDSEGMIDVNIPVNGQIDTPEFSMGHLVWQAIGNVLGNIATAPFKALGAMFGGDGFDGVYFNLGESVITPPEREKLEKLAIHASKKSTTHIQFYGTYDPEADRIELARVQADRAILIGAGFKINDDEPLPSPSLADPRIQSGLKTAYGSQVGRIQLVQRLLKLPNTPERWDQLRDELIKSYRITDQQLIDLANLRAKNAQTIFLKKSPELASRVSLGKAQVFKLEDLGIALGVSLNN
ncbi:MAG: hypothetical protein RLZZ410_1599 [Pseudomonadota bacterium]|jgi:hypothetical protein